MFPSNIPSFTTSDPNKTLDEDNHTKRHNDVQNAIVSVATKVGVNDSTDVNSLDYKVGANTLKLAGVEAEATKNQTDAHLLDRANHTGEQLMSSISDAGDLATKDTIEAIHSEVGRLNSFTVPSKTHTIIPFTTVFHDTHGAWNNSAKHFVIPKSGIYLVNGSIRLEDTNGQFRYHMRFDANSSVSANKIFSDTIGGGNTGDSPSVHGANGSVVQYYEEGDTIHMTMWHNIPSTRSYPYSGHSHAQNYMSITRLSDWIPS